MKIKFSNISKKSWAVLALSFVFILIALGIGYYFMQNGYSFHSDTTTNSSNNGQPVSSADQKAETKKSIRVLAAGDFLPHDALNQAAKTSSGYDYMQFMTNFKPYFQKADVRFCNQAVMGAGEKFGISGYPVFNSPTEFVRDMANLGCNVINTGTNHSNDKGQELINANEDVWDKTPGILARAGDNRSEAEKQKVSYFEKDGIKFAFLAYSTYSNSTITNGYGVNMWSNEFVAAQLNEARPKVDVILVSVRWGTEYSPLINSSQETYAKFLADNGADVVFGHGQHVQGPVKKLPRAGGGDTVVWYGIGNFINAQLPPEALFNGLPIVDIDLATKKVTDLEFLPFYMHYEWTADQKAREDLLARRNFMMYTFDQADAPLAKSQNNTTITAQKDRLSKVLNQFTSVKILEPNEY